MTKVAHQQLRNYMPMLGSDPEFFFEKGGDILGSERFIPEGGLVNNPYNTTGNFSKFVPDGIQAEFNPVPHTCRAGMMTHFRQQFTWFEEEIKKKDPKVKLSFSRLVEVTKKELSGLSEKSQVLGCAPSNNLYNPGANIGVDPQTYMKRSAGGHIHIGLPFNDPVYRRVKTEYEKFVLMLDVFVGNTSVLLDQDPGNAERRKVYGRAGEYRVPKHGVEYRTPSNYWLEHPMYLSFIFGLTRLALSVCCGDSKKDYVEEVMQYVNIGDIVTAINENDFDLAYKNFLGLEPYLSKALPSNGSSFGLGSNNLHMFKTFVEGNRKKRFIGSDVMENWKKLENKTSNGFGYFLDVAVGGEWKVTAA